MSQENEDVVKRFYREVLGQGRIDVLDQLFTTDYVEHQDLNIDRPGLDGARAWFQAIDHALPDRIVVLDDLIAEGDRVVARWHLTATFLGDLLGLPPSGLLVAISATAVFRLEAGRIVEGWHVADSEALMQQLKAQPITESRTIDSNLAGCGVY